MIMDDVRCVKLSPPIRWAIDERTTAAQVLGRASSRNRWGYWRGLSDAPERDDNRSYDVACQQPETGNINRVIRAAKKPVVKLTLQRWRLGFRRLHHCSSAT